MKALVTQYHALDIKELARGYYLYPFCSFEWVWRTNRDSQAATVRITVLEGVLQLLLPSDPQQRPQEIQVAYSTGSNGGKRPWFSCPACRRRVGILYHAPSLSFRCRECHRLAYPSQYEGRRRGHGRHHRIINHADRDRRQG